MGDILCTDAPPAACELSNGWAKQGFKVELKNGEFFKSIYVAYMESTYGTTRVLLNWNSLKNANWMEVFQLVYVRK